MKDLITIKDAVIVPLLLVIAYLWATAIRNKHIEEKPYYKYFRLGLFVKIFAGLLFILVYLFYYGGGDTQYYFTGTRSIVRMITKDVPTFLKLLGGDHSAEVYSMFDRYTWWPTYFRDPNSFSVCRFNVPLYILSFGSYMGNTILMNMFLFVGVWRFYVMLANLYPGKDKLFAYALFFIPSVVFWSSGILKDGWTLTAILFIYSNIWHVFFQRKAVFVNILWLVFWSYVAISIRPFVFYVVIASTVIWLSFSSITTIKSRFFRVIFVPIVLLVAWSIGTLLFLQVSSLSTSRYKSIDSMLETAWIIQDDLTRDYYGGNNFDIGTFEPTISGVLGKAPQAIVAGIFRPFIWEGNGILLLFSGLENLFLLMFAVWIVIKSRFVGFFREIYKEPLLLSLTVFFITFAFMVGLTTANFGALVRYRIPVLPIFGVIMLVVYDRYHLTKT